MPDEIIIRAFQPADAEAFRLLNEEWIERYFKLEPKDRETLGDPQHTILDKGGRILVAVRAGVTVGCCALIEIADREYELAKLAVSPGQRRLGIGRKLMTAAIEAGERIGAKRLYLESNSVLPGAVPLYLSMDFQDVPPERRKPSIYARADVFMERMLTDDRASVS